MNDKALRVLEFNKVKEEIKKYALTGASKDTIDELAPYENIHEVKEHLQETKEALTLLQKKGAPPFEGLYDVREAVTRAGKGGTLNPGQLLRIGNMVRCARRFIEFIKRKDEEQSYNILEDICAGLTPIRKLEDTIFNAIIGEEEISDKASQTLNNIRRSLKERNSSVRDKVNSILRENSKYLQDNLYTMRGDRYVIPVKAEHKGSVPGLIHDQSSTGATVFIEPMSLVKINNEIKELMLKEKAEIERILQELSGFVYDEIIAVRNNANILNELDFIFAKAKYASAIDAICPAVNGNGIVDLVQAKHPLIDPKRVVSSDIYLGREFTSLVVTGPNTGGKTVTLKTVGLLHIMAMSGVLIPARENSTVSFFREIYADIGDEQSIEQSLSTFSSHMTNIVSIMEEADNESLVLFDELGAGTDPTEGAALAVAILETLRHRNCKIVATTHYSELKGYALRTIGVENASVEFDVETLRPTYKLLIGIPGKSNAFEISRRLGLSDDVIDKSKELISSESLQFEDLIQSLQEKSMKAERDAREAEMLKLDARKLREKYEVKLENLEKTRENAFGEARREAKQILREAKEEADQILKNMRELERLGYDSDARRKLEEQRSKLRDKLDKTETVINKAEKDNGETIEVVKPGMEAFLPSLNQKVIILTMPDSKGDVQVEAGIMKVNVKLKDLRKSKETKEAKKKVRREVNINTKSVASSVDLRGLDAEEACYNADKYLDEAYMGGLGEVSLIHGKGTGILRKSINDMLKSHPHVKSYRLGEYGEGGTGVTVVQLK
ncbi:endonuclease MutS2 [Clostridium sp. YIM B02505]|uniref:Endonuclease MutS2 n=1 Tax=Clostridium yunnanense TaxID=2800325 RepID=A0ABS1EIP7_9CLOT|nr:endonuclease MutS2 [Clostridium yunnanense]MBK1809231.1 endonuclease MutS2 [Clostridium yunnanense]